MVVPVLVRIKSATGWNGRDARIGLVYLHINPSIIGNRLTVGLAQKSIGIEASVHTIHCVIVAVSCYQSAQ
jgi:hypothetical protein